MNTTEIILHTKEEFAKMRKAGKLAAQLLVEIETQIIPGISTKALDIFAFEFIRKYSTKSACFGYKGRGKIAFPGYVCTSINHVVCHGIPNEQILQEGDIIGIDVTLICDGYHGDTCKTFGVGKISDEAQDLINITQKAMYVGIDAAIENNHIGDIGAAIEKFIHKQEKQYSIVETYCGHGIGQTFHAPPEVQHVGIKNTGPLIKQGMFFTVEPMINLGMCDTRLLKDEWTVITKDYSLSAQFEHTIGIGENGTEIFTQI